MARVTKISIEDELKAGERGECLLCRISARHPDDSPCPRAPELNAFWTRKAQGISYGPFVSALLDKGAWSDLDALRTKRQFLLGRKDLVELVANEEREIILADLHLINCQITHMMLCSCSCHLYARPGWLIINNQWGACPECNPDGKEI